MAEEYPPQPPRTVYVKRLRRWRFAIILAALSAAVVVAAAAGWRFARTSSAPSNGPIIVISIDTLRADHLPVYGYRGARTPAIDALAAEGVVFEHAYAHSPQTLPSHVAILSGQLPFETGVRDDVGFVLRPDTRLLPQILHARGYASGAVVSSFRLRRETGLAQAFDFFDDEMPAPAEGAQPAFERPGPDSVAVAQKWIARLSSPRFFLFLHLDEPHAPYAPPARFAQYAPYDGEIACADEVVGRFLKWLKGRGLYDRATIVLLSDHGEALGDHGEQQHGLLLHDATLRIPLVVKLPRDVNHGHRAAAPVQHIDLVPTILDLLDMPKAPGLRGRSLRALLEGRPAKLAAQPLYAESFAARYRLGWSPLRAITDGGYRFIAAPHERLFELGQDPAEQTNLAAQRPEIAQSMRLRLDEILGGAADSPASPVPFAERQRFASLGELAPLPGVASALPSSPPVDPNDEAGTYESCRHALSLAAEHRDGEAAAAYRGLLRDRPGMPGVWLQFARVMLRADRTTDAIEAFERAAALAPADPAGLVASLGAARALLQAGRLDEAKSYATAAVKRAPADAHTVLARIAVKRRDAPEAARQAALVDEADPSRHAARYMRGLALHAAGKYDAAAPAFEEALREAPDAITSAPLDVVDLDGVHYAFGETLSRLDRYPEAEAQFKEEIRLFPQRIPARVSLTMLYHAQRRDADAQRAVDDLTTAVPTPDGYSAAARLWAILGDKERATATRAAARERFGIEPARGPR